jgi:hypothetical protein
MAIREKPTQTTIEDFINKGGSVPSEKKSPPNQKKYLLSVPSDILEKVDNSVENSRVLSRNGWIIQSIIEKLERESNHE